MPNYCAKIKTKQGKCKDVNFIAPSFSDAIVELSKKEKECQVLRLDRAGEDLSSYSTPIMRNNRRRNGKKY
jgi:hypothetical protein